MSSLIVAALVTYGSVAALVLVWSAFYSARIRKLGGEVFDSVSKRPEARMLNEKQLKFLTAIVWVWVIAERAILWPRHVREIVVDEFPHWRESRKKKVENDKK